MTFLIYFCFFFLLNLSKYIIFKILSKYFLIQGLEYSTILSKSFIYCSLNKLVYSPILLVQLDKIYR